MEEVITYVLLAASGALNVHFFFKTKELADSITDLNKCLSLAKTQNETLQAELKVAKAKPTAEASYFLNELLNNGATVNIEVLDKQHLMLRSPKDV